MPSVEFNIPAVMAKVREGAMRGIVRGTENVRSEAVRLLLNPPKTGRIYRRRGVTHQASAPGEAPASDTGRLVNSITTSYNRAAISGRVTARTAYAAFLEFGTQRMEPRPFMRPALENMRASINADIANEVRQALG